MNKTKTFLITLIIVGMGFLLLYFQYWSMEQPKIIEFWLWTLIVGILFAVLTIIGHYIFEYERKKYIEI